MQRFALITDAQTPLGEQLVRRYLAAGHYVAATRSNQERFETPLVSEEDRLLLIDWNRTSPISARNVLLAALNRFDALDEALLLQTPQLPRGPLQELSYETIERAVDAWVKGTLFLAKGILETFAQRRAGSLAFVQQVEGSAALPPLEAALRGSFRAAARSLAAAVEAGSAGRSLQVNSFECHDPDAWDAEGSGFASFILETMQSKGRKSSGRCFRFPGRGRRLIGLVRRRTRPAT
jgi:NAD(P)-dependent dehydrogenase (short-subunit alcohol dehydrogenase family)